MSAAGGDEGIGRILEAMDTPFDVEVWREQFIALMRIGHREGVLSAVFPAGEIEAAEARLKKLEDAKNWRIEMRRQLDRAVVDFGAGCAREERELAAYLAFCARLHTTGEAG